MFLQYFRRELNPGTRATRRLYSQWGWQQANRFDRWWCYDIIRYDVSWLLQNDVLNVLVMIVFPIKQAMMSFAIFRCFDDKVLFWLWRRMWFHYQNREAL